jgi:hypothetical protein
MRKYLMLFVVTMLIVQIALPGANRVSASGGQTQVYINEMGNGFDGFEMPPGVDEADVDWTRADQVGFYKMADMQVDASGNLYLIPENHYRVYKVTPAGDLSVFLGLGSYKDRYNNISPNGDQEPAIGKLANEVGIGRPKSLAIDSHNNIYIAAESTGNIYKVNASTNLITDIYVDLLETGRKVENITIDSSGNLYVYQSEGAGATYHLGKLNVNDASPKVLTPFTKVTLPTGDDRFLHVAVDNVGDLYFLRAGSNSAVW